MEKLDDTGCQMRLTELLRNSRSQVTCVGDPDAVEINSIVNDSRKVKPGSLFAAVPGLKVNGAQFAADAYVRGAPAVLTERLLPIGFAVQLITDNVRATLGELLSSFHGRPSEQMLMVGVTGTNGKTTVTHFLESILRVAGYRPGLVGTIYTRFAGRQQRSSHTTPDSPVLQPLLVDMLGQGVNACVMELSSHALSLHRLAGCQFDCVGITNITHDHLDFHRSFEAYRDAKLSAFGLLKHGVGIAVTNRHDVASQLLRAHWDHAKYSFGFSQQADVHLVGLQHFGLAGTQTIIRVPTGEVTCIVRLPGMHNVANALCAAAIATGLGIDPQAISVGLSSVRAVPGRLQPVQGQFFHGIVDFAHNPDGLRNLLSTCRKLTAGRVILVFGCEGRKDTLKRMPMGRIAAELADLSFLTSDNWYDEDPRNIFATITDGYLNVRSTGLTVIPERDSAIETAVAAANPHDLIVVAGRGPERLLVFGDEKHVFDDAEYLAECIARRERSEGCDNAIAVHSPDIEVPIRPDSLINIALIQQTHPINVAVLHSSQNI